MFRSPSNVSYDNFTNIIDYLGEVTTGFFMPLLVASFFLIILIAFKKFGMERAFASASFSTMIVCILFKMAGVLNVAVLTVSIVATIGSFIWLWISSSK